jgi:hypothetical protein
VYCRHGTSESALLPVSCCLVVAAAVLLSCALTRGVVVVVVVVQGSGCRSVVLSAWPEEVCCDPVTCNAARKSLDFGERVICITRK